MMFPFLVSEPKKPPKARVNIIRGSQPTIEENTTAVATIQAVGAGTMTYAIVAGDDGALFSINGSSGALAFASAPNYEIPGDADTDNIYEVTVSATNNGTPALSDTKKLFVTVTDAADETVVNGGFAADTDWTKGAGWTIAGGKAVATTASTAISQNVLAAGISYDVTYTITRAVGTVTPKCGTVAGITRNASGTYSETIVSNGTTLSFLGAGFTGTLDDVSAIG